MLRTFLRTLGGISQAPRAFPGKYPTRIWIRSTQDLTFPFEYVGKPVPELLQRVHAEYFSKGGPVNRLYILEYDQNGLIYRTQGGENPSTASFYPLYFPMPSFYRDYFSRSKKLFSILDRELVEINGKTMYQHTFWKNTQWAPLFQQMLEDCSRGRVNRIWFGEHAAEEITDFIATRVDAWTRPINPQIAATLEMPVANLTLTAALPQIPRWTRIPRPTQLAPRAVDPETWPTQTAQGNAGQQTAPAWHTPTAQWAATLGILDATPTPPPPPQPPPPRRTLAQLLQEQRDMFAAARATAPRPRGTEN